MNLRPVALGLVIVMIIAFAFLIPIVPFSVTVDTGLNGMGPLPSLPCSNPNNRSGSSAVNPTTVYQGYESISHYLTNGGGYGELSGVDIIIYTKCTIR